MGPVGPPDSESVKQTWGAHVLAAGDPPLEIETIHSRDPVAGIHDVVIETGGAGIRVRFGWDDHGAAVIRVSGPHGGAEPEVIEGRIISMRLETGMTLSVAVEDFRHGRLSVELLAS